MAIREEQLFLAKSFGLQKPLRLTEGITKGELATILGRASQDSYSLMLFNMAQPGFSSAIRARQFEAATRGLGSLSSSMWGQVGALTRKGVYAAAEMAADSQLDRDYLVGMPYKAVRQYTDSMYFSAFQSAEDIISRRTAGFALADRIYRNGKATVMQVGKIIETGLAQQLSARELAARVRGHFSPNVPGGSSYASMRLARTEINNAHHETTIRLSKDKPWVNGYKWNLSGSHPKPDRCDDYANEDHDGLGDGVFSKNNVPSKPHPQCLCYVGLEQMDPKEFNKRLAKGDFDNYLKGRGVHC